MESLVRISAMLEIKTDGIHHGTGTGNRAADWICLTDIRSDWLKKGIIAVEQRPTSVWVSGRNPDGASIVTQMADDPATKEAGPCKNRGKTLARRHSCPSSSDYAPPFQTGKSVMWRADPMQGRALNPQHHPR
jgi:hypothetical protein